MDEGTVYYAKQDDVVVLKLVGPFAFSLKASKTLDSFINEMLIDDDFDNILIDLTETRNIDSTNLGLLAMITRINMDLHDCMATIISTNDDVTQTLDGVGFREVFHIIQDPHNPEAEFKRLEEECAPSVTQLSKLVLNAHRELFDLNEQNKIKFRDVVELLEQQTSEHDNQN